MTDAGEAPCTQIEWHRQEDGHQVVVSVDGTSVRIAVVLAPDARRSSLEAAWEELVREFDHHGSDEGSSVPLHG